MGIRHQRVSFLRGLLIVFSIEEMRAHLSKYEDRKHEVIELISKVMKWLGFSTALDFDVLKQKVRPPLSPPPPHSPRIGFRRRRGELAGASVSRARALRGAGGRGFLPEG